MILRTVALAAVFFALGTISISVAHAWIGPTAAPPGNNVAAPVNVGTTAQVKNGGLGVNSLAVFGNAILSGVGRYFNFGSTAGTNGYGIRDTAGLLEFKNSGGSWESIQATVFNLVGGASSWTVSGNNIYNANTGSVGIGTASPGAKLDVAGEIVSDTIGSGGGNIRMIGGNYGFFFRNDGANTYLLLTNSGDQYGTWNGLRPFYINNATGDVTFGSSAVFNNNVGIGTASPGAKLEVAGQVKITGGTPGAGKVLTSDAAGLASWATQSGGSGFTGSGTTNYVIKFTGATALGNSVIYDNGTNVGIGTAAPGYKLHVAGDIYANGGWLRTSGNAGWYSETWGGGWYMQDSTWIRSYNSKPVYMSAGFDTGTPSGVGCSGGLGGEYTFRVCGSQQVTSGLYTNILYDSDNTGYYLDPSGTSNVANMYAAGNIWAAAFLYNSDIRLKKNVFPLANALQKVLQLQPVTFNWTDTNLPSATQIGFIAQQVERVEPTLVTASESTSMKSVDYARVTPLLVGALQEQEKKIEDQQRQIDELRAELQTLKSK